MFKTLKNKSKKSISIKRFCNTKIEKKTNLIRSVFFKKLLIINKFKKLMRFQKIKYLKICWKALSANQTTKVAKKLKFERTFLKILMKIKKNSFDYFKVAFFRKKTLHRRAKIGISIFFGQKTRENILKNSFRVKFLKHFIGLWRSSFKFNSNFLSLTFKIDQRKIKTCFFEWKKKLFLYRGIKFLKHKFEQRLIIHHARIFIKNMSQLVNFHFLLKDKKRKLVVLNFQALKKKTMQKKLGRIKLKRFLVRLEFLFEKHCLAQSLLGFKRNSLFVKFHLKQKMEKNKKVFMEFRKHQFEVAGQMKRIRLKIVFKKLQKIAQWSFQMNKFAENSFLCLKKKRKFTELKNEIGIKAKVKEIVSVCLLFFSGFLNKKKLESSFADIKIFGKLKTQEKGLGYFKRFKESIEFKNKKRVFSEICRFSRIKKALLSFNGRNLKIAQQFLKIIQKKHFLKLKKKKMLFSKVSKLLRKGFFSFKIFNYEQKLFQKKVQFLSLKFCFARFLSCQKKRKFCFLCLITSKTINSKLRGLFRYFFYGMKCKFITKTHFLRKKRNILGKMIRSYILSRLIQNLELFLQRKIKQMVWLTVKQNLIEKIEAYFKF